VRHRLAAAATPADQTDSSRRSPTRQVLIPRARPPRGLGAGTYSTLRDGSETRKITGWRVSEPCEASRADVKCGQGHLGTHALCRSWPLRRPAPRSPGGDRCARARHLWSSTPIHPTVPHWQTKVEFSPKLSGATGHPRGTQCCAAVALLAWAMAAAAPARARPEPPLKIASRRWTHWRHARLAVGGAGTSCWCPRATLISSRGSCAPSDPGPGGYAA